MKELLLCLCVVFCVGQAVEEVISHEEGSAVSNFTRYNVTIASLKSRFEELERLKLRVVSMQNNIQEAIFSLQSCSQLSSSIMSCFNQSTLDRFESAIAVEDEILASREQQKGKTSSNFGIFDSFLTLLTFFPIIIPWLQQLEKIWTYAMDWLGIFDKLPNIVTTFVALFVNQQLQEANHHRRDYSDRISVTWHYYEDDEEGKKCCRAVTEASLNLKDTFRDDPVLYQKIKQAILVDHEGYPPNCILVGRRIHWSQYWDSWKYFFLTYLAAVGDYLLSFLPFLPQGSSCARIHASFEKDEKLYTPSSDDNTLLKRRLRNILSEKVANSHWPKHVKNRSFASHSLTEARTPSTALTQRRTRSTSSVPPPPPSPPSLPHPMVSSTSRRYSSRDVHAQESTKDLIYTLTEKDRERIFAIPFYEKSDTFEVKELKIVLIYGKDLLYCRDRDEEKEAVYFEYPHWKIRDQEIRDFARFLNDYTNEKDRYHIKNFWTTLIVPE